MSEMQSLYGTSGSAGQMPSIYQTRAHSRLGGQFIAHLLHESWRLDYMESSAQAAIICFEWFRRYAPRAVVGSDRHHPDATDHGLNHAQVSLIRVAQLRTLGRSSCR